MPSRETFAYRRALKLRAARATEDMGSSVIDNVFARAQDDFLTFCTLLDKAPAHHMLEWHRHLITGESNRYLLDISGPNLDILAPRGSAKSTVLNMFTAWCIGRHTAAKRPLQIIYVSYNIATAIPKSRIIRQIVDSPEFMKVFPTCRLKPGMQSDVGWSIDFDYAGIPRVGDEEFTLRAAGLRGSITSKRAHLCLLGDTLVQTNQGLKSLEYIYKNPDGLVIAVLNQRTHQIDWSDLGAVTKRSTGEIIRIETTCGRYISATPEHPFLTSEGGYKRAGDLSEGETLIGVPRSQFNSVLPCLRGNQEQNTANLSYLLEKSRKVSSRVGMSDLQRKLFYSVRPLDSEAFNKSKCPYVLSSLRGSVASNSDTPQLPAVQESLQTYFSSTSSVFAGVCAAVPLGSYEGSKEFELSPRLLRRGFQNSSENCPRERQFLLRRMWYKGEKVSYKRRLSPNKPLCSSYRSQSEQQYPRKFNNFMPAMSCCSSSNSGQSWETFTVSRITKDSSRKNFVYDLEVTHPDHNFIANDFVVSNCLIDDPVKSSADIKNPAIRAEMDANWTSVIAPIIFEGGRAICLGTRFHPLDIHKSMFCPEKGWKQVVQEALTYDDAGEPQSYWPEQWSVDYLMQQKELDPVAFAFQYQQQPVMTSDLVLSPDLIVKGEVVTEFDSLAVGIDLSASKNETSDYTAFVLGGRLKDNYYIIDAHQVRSIGNLEKIDLLCDMLVEWGILQLQNGEYFPTYSTVTLVVESVAYQASLAADLRRVLLNERGLSNLHIHEVKGFRGDKIARFRGTLGLLENKKVIFNKYRRFDALVDQLINIGATSHDDLLDAYTWLMTFLQRRGNFTIEY